MSEAPSCLVYSPQFTEALVYATNLHAGQCRKGTTIPYISHLLAVASLVAEYGGDETAVIAALLHDAVEDQGGIPRLNDIQARFGADVAAIVLACSDSTTTPRPPWRERKEAYLAHLADASPAMLLVSAADKLHNARSILADLRRDGPATLKRFNGGATGTLWYYQQLAATFTRLQVGPLAGELARVVAEIARLAA